MDEIFSNILYLIPIAFFIAIRIIGARNKQSGKEQQQKKEDEGMRSLLKKIREAQENPAYGRALTEDRGVFIPPRSPAPAKQPEQKKKAVKQAAKKPAKKQTAPSSARQSAVQTSIAETALAKNAAASAKKDPAAQASGLSGIRPGWTPLQQAVVWSEILGAPKGA